MEKHYLLTLARSYRPLMLTNAVFVRTITEQTASIALAELLATDRNASIPFHSWHSKERLPA